MIFFIVCGYDNPYTLKVIIKQEMHMGMMDGMNGEDMMSDPDKRAQIEEIAKREGISIDDAKIHFLRQNNQ